MHSKARFQNLMFGASLSPASAAVAIMVMLFFLILLLILINLTAQPAQGQTYQVIHNFTGGPDGANPNAGVTWDYRTGNLYGTAFNGGTGYGTVYQLKHNGSGWIFNRLYSFSGGSDGASPPARVIFGPDGSLYGTTAWGGKLDCNPPDGCGTVFKLTPAPTACKTALCPWTETVLYQFAGIPDGASPSSSDLIIASREGGGGIYGTTWYGGGGYSGVVYELIPSGGGWTESVVWSFSGPDGRYPNGVTFGEQGDGIDYSHLYGTTIIGGGSGPYGTVFQLVATRPGWTENVLYRFNGNDGNQPLTGVESLYSGLYGPMLYGSTSNGGSGGGGTLYELSGYNLETYTLLYSFTGGAGCGPQALVDFVGTTYCDGAYGYGNVFKLTNTGSGWTYTSLHDFTGGADGGNPISNVEVDVNGNMYGTTSSGGAYGFGVVWEITP